MRPDEGLRRLLANAIATLKGARRQKEIAFAYVEAGSEKAGAASLGMKLPTAKAHMQELYRKNGVACLAHLLLLAFGNLVARMRDDPGGRQDDQPESPSPAGPAGS